MNILSTIGFILIVSGVSLCFSGIQIQIDKKFTAPKNAHIVTVDKKVFLEYGKINGFKLDDGSDAVVIIARKAKEEGGAYGEVKTNSQISR